MKRIAQFLEQTLAPYWYYWLHWWSHHFGLVVRFLDEKLVPDWRDWWQWWSYRFGVIAGFFMQFVLWPPEATLVFWNMVPTDVQYLLPGNLHLYLGMAFSAAALLARLVKQHPKKGQADEQ
ncbi:hypothetical protein [Alterisphingorhabdus coralli]|uniref:Uncharacterized protein n=1 Tax=Alterisphingorhabdus coralli TaxID=3071408 RepID=A0AA97FC44_9SPHN|nr:hypothetical protein [Parasphingorhabdus sp. SCSIO 66989]WOE76330.1 hypothetical protein RB602_06355 [Parasphingorhabdus sp. SCSIO 66989]